MTTQEPIRVADLFGTHNLEKVKFRFDVGWSNEEYEDEYRDLKKLYFEDSAKIEEMVRWHDPQQRRVKNGETVFNFIQLGDEEWLFISAITVTDDSKVFVDGDVLPEYNKYSGRLIATFLRGEDNKGKPRGIVYTSEAVISKVVVKTILPSSLAEGDNFPGYENVDLSWHDLKRVIGKDAWKTALENQKGVYLITDTKTNKRYVGSAYGDKMMLGRWKNYAENGHGGNIELKKLIEAQSFEYVKLNFRYSILDIYKSTTDDKIIIGRESWWKEVLLSRNEDFGYNAN